MLTRLVLLALPLLLSVTAVPAAPRFTPDTAKDAATLKKMATEKRLIKTGERTPAKWMTDAEIQKLYAQHAHFMDITDTQRLEEGAAPRPASLLDSEATPTGPTQQAIVNPIIAQGNTSLMKSTLETLSQFNNRYYRSSTGAESANWLFGKVKEVVAQSATKLQVTVSQFQHSWGQHSIIARIEGQNDNKETVIVGAHQDSINGGNPIHEWTCTWC